MDRFHIYQKILKCIRDKEMQSRLKKLYDACKTDELLESIQIYADSIATGEEKDRNEKKVLELYEYLVGNKEYLLSYQDREGIKIPKAPDGLIYKNLGTQENQNCSIITLMVVNDSVTREAITKDQMRKFLKFVHDDNVYYKYYEVVYILFHTGMRISEFCGLTLRDIDMENKVINIDHQLQRIFDMRLVIESTKTNAVTRKLPMTEDVAQCFRAIIEDREEPKCERVVDGYAGFLFTDKNGYPEVAMHWEHRFNHMVKRYNDIYRVQMPNITPHICRHTYCSNMAKSGMNPKTLQYLMGHSDIGVTLNTYTHLGLEDATDELRRMEELEDDRKELEKNKEEKPVSQKIQGNLIWKERSVPCFGRAILILVLYCVIMC